MKICFEKVEQRASKSTKCKKCGKKLKRSTTFFQTLSPFNRNKDGSVKTKKEIEWELAEKRLEWIENSNFYCKKCEEDLHVG